MSPAADTPQQPSRIRPDAVIDASVLFQEPVRSLLLWIAANNGFRPAWSQLILAETGRNLVAQQATTEMSWTQLKSTMTTRFPHAMVELATIRPLEPNMPNHPKDRHVLAAAVASGAPYVVTNNLKHFRSADLQSLGVAALNADAYLGMMLNRAPQLVQRALDQQAGHLRRPREWSTSEVLGRLAGLGPGDALAPSFAKQAALAFGIRMSTPPERPPPTRTLSRTGLQLRTSLTR